MRRPTLCSSLNDGPVTHRASPAPSSAAVAPAHSTSAATIPENHKESRLAKVKRMITDGILMGRRKKEVEGEKENSGGTVSVCLRGAGETLKELHIEVPASSNTHIVLKPRKRKERLDSGGSLKQETKVIRSSSEERHEVKADVNVRRVWSHDELKVLAKVNRERNADADNDSHTSHSHTAHDHKLDASGPLDAEEIEEREAGVICEDLEARRSTERFSRGAAPRRRKVSRRAPPPDRSPSPTCTRLDISSLHQQMEGSEPLTSRGKILSPDDDAESPAVEALISPRNSLVMRLEYLDASVPPSPPQTHLHALRQHDKHERRLLRQITSIKRHLKRYEEGFKTEFGYKPSPADKLANKDIKHLMSDLSRYKLQLKELREGESDGRQADVLPRCDSAEKTDFHGSPTKPLKAHTIEEALEGMQKRLEEKRLTSGRSFEIGDLSSEQLVEEKLAVQKALLTLESAFGRPVAQCDRDLVRPLYQRYRALKRLVVRNPAGKLNSSATELATILEHEAMEFSPSASVDVGEEDEEGQGEEIPNQSDEPLEDAGPSSSSSDSLAENFHALPLSQLLEHQKKIKEEKKKLRRNLREFEERFQSQMGRKAQKQDRIAIETIYVSYKQSKAKLRLLEALIAKKSQVKRNSC